MSFFKDFKDDFAEAVDELVPGGAGEQAAKGIDNASKKIDTDVDADAELSKLDGLLEQVAKRVDEDASKASGVVVPEEVAKPNVSVMKSEVEKENRTMDSSESYQTTVDTAVREGAMAAAYEPEPVSDENAVITKNMKITGDLESTGSIEVQGQINGNVRCNGKLTVAGNINGNSTSSEFFADAARIQGEISSTGTVKIGVNSVVIGNITASSAVIAGAVKGDIDIQGPVVVDSSAVVAGNIVSRSVQINNGAVIEGFCSQKYADMDVNSVFER